MVKKYSLIYMNYHKYTYFYYNYKTTKTDKTFLYKCIKKRLTIKDLKSDCYGYIFL